MGRKRKHEQCAEALEVLHKVIAAQPQRALAFVQAEYSLAKLNRHEEASRSYARALEIAPNYGEAHAYMGLTYHDLGLYREALESLNRAIRMKPSLTDDPYCLHMLGLTSGHAEQWEQSFAAFTKLTERDSEALTPLKRGIQLEPQKQPHIVNSEIPISNCNGSTRPLNNFKNI